MQISSSDVIVCSLISVSQEIQLLAAAEEGNEIEIKNLLGEGVNIHCKDAVRVYVYMYLCRIMHARATLLFLQMEAIHSFPYTSPGLELVAAHNSLS